MNKYILLPFLMLVLAIDAFAYSFVGEGKPEPVFDKDLNWLSAVVAAPPMACPLVSIFYLPMIC